MSKDILKADGILVVSPDQSMTAATERLAHRFESAYRARFHATDPTSNRNLLQRFTQDPLVTQLFSSEILLDKVRQLAGLSDPIQTGPVVSHYTSTDCTGNSYALGFHQDWPSMATSERGVVCWIALTDCSQESHSLSFIPRTHKNGALPGIQTDKGYSVDTDYCINPTTLSVEAGSLVMFSPWLVHGTYLNEKAPKSVFKLALSTRFDDLECETWHDRGYGSAYSTTVNRELWKRDR